jgi:hypothetical protein
MSYVAVSHPISSLYIVRATPRESQKYLLLSQSYDKGWYAFDLSIFHSLTGPILVNNWENGWELPTPKNHSNGPDTIIILFLPQLLEVLGFGVLGILIGALIRKRPSQ